MIKVVGVKFRPGGKTYYFDPADLDIEQGDDLIVETARGIEFGHAVFGVRLVENEEVVRLRTRTAGNTRSSGKSTIPRLSSARKRSRRAVWT